MQSTNQQRSSAQKEGDSMKNNSFTHDEINLMCIYDVGSRKGLIKELNRTLALMSKEDAELASITESAITKLQDMTDDQYSVLELYPDYL